MAYGQEVDEATIAEAMSAEGTATKGPRGFVPSDLAAAIRRTRAAEQWQRYDTIVVGPGAQSITRGWYDNLAQFAQADRLTWFAGREPNVGNAYTNQRTERYDFAQDLYQFGAEFYAPTGFAEYERSTEAQFLVDLWTKELPQRLAFEVKLADVDNVLVIPGAHAPAGVGRTGAFGNDAPAPMFDGGTQGVPHTSNSWKWPEPLMIPAKGLVSVTARIDDPLRSFLRELGTFPGSKAVPAPLVATPTNGGVSRVVTYPNWFMIRLFLRGPRYVQLLCDGSATAEIDTRARARRRARAGGSSRRRREARSWQTNATGSRKSSRSSTLAMPCSARARARQATEAPRR